MTLQRLPVRERLSQPLAVHLHPLVADQHQAVAGAAQRLQLPGRQRAVAQGDLDAEVQHRVGAHPRRRRAADRDRHLRPLPLAPPVGHPYREAAALQLRHALQEAIGMLGRPGQRAVEIAGVGQSPHPVACPGRLLHRRQQVDQRRPVLRPGVLLQGAAQRQVLEASPRAEACGVGGQERERPLLVVPVLGQVEADPSHLPPARRPCAQQAGHAARGRGGVLHPRVELLPQALQEVRREILASLHRRSVQDPGGQERVARRLDRHLLGVRRQVAEPGQVVFRKLLPVAQAGDLLGRQLLRRQGEERAAPIAPKGVQHRSQSGRGFLRCGIRLPAQMTGRRQSHAHGCRLCTAGRVVDIRTGETPARPRLPSCPSAFL